MAMSIDWIPSGSKRKITPKEQGNRGYLPSNKVPNGIAEYESCLERDMQLNCHHAPSVKTFQHQPVQILYSDNIGKSRKYTPDLYVEYTNGKKALYEIGYEADKVMNASKYIERWVAAKKWAFDHGMIFEVLTEREIRTARRENIWFTLGSSKSINNSKYMNRLIDLIPKDGLNYNILCFLLSEDLGVEINKSAQILCYAIYHGFVFVDTFSTKQLSKDTIIRKKRNSVNSPFKSLWDCIHEKINKDNDDIDIEKSKKNLMTDNLFEPSIIPEKYEEIVDFREKIIKLWLRTPSKKRTANWREEFCANWNVSQRSLYRWIKKYNESGIKGLIPNHKKSGKLSKYNKKTLELMEAARQIYLKPTISLKKAYKKLKEFCIQENDATLPSESSFQYFVYNNTTASEFARKRGRKYHKSFFTPSLKSFQGAYIPMQIVQMDNTPFDIFPVDEEEREGLSTPYMTAAIDCYTKMITGFSISYNPSSAMTVTEVLIQNILPKNKYVRNYQTEHTWEIQGFPVVVLVDNGMDYRSDAMKELCLKYDMIIEFAPLRTPRYKALIEQWFNVLHKGLDYEDVPALRPMLKYRLENPDLKPEEDAVLTLQEIETWVHKWVVDEYHLRNQYNDHVPAPYLKWVDFQNGNTKLILPLPREPPNMKSEIDSLYLCTLSKIKRTLSRDGVVWEYLKYNNTELSKLYNILGKKKNIEVYLNNRDVRSVWVVNPISNNIIHVGLASGWAQSIAKVNGDRPINASAWIKQVRQMKKYWKKRITPLLYKREMSEMKRHELIQNGFQKTKTIRKQKEKEKEELRKQGRSNLALIPMENELTVIEEFEDETEETESKEIYDPYSESGIAQEINENDELDIYSIKSKGLIAKKYPKKQF